MNSYNSRHIGREYEDAATLYLENKGYRILDRNYQVRVGEIDIVAKNGKYIVFVEVKYRSNNHVGLPGEAVDGRKRKRISKVALYYLNQKGYGLDVPVRFDVITVTNEIIDHIENAYDYSDR